MLQYPRRVAVHLPLILLPFSSFLLGALHRVQLERCCYTDLFPVLPSGILGGLWGSPHKFTAVLDRGSRCAFTRMISVFPMFPFSFLKVTIIAVKTATYVCRRKICWKHFLKENIAATLHHTLNDKSLQCCNFCDWELTGRKGAINANV